MTCPEALTEPERASSPAGPPEAGNGQAPGGSAQANRRSTAGGRGGRDQSPPCASLVGTSRISCPAGTNGRGVIRGTHAGIRDPAGSPALGRSSRRYQARLCVPREFQQAFTSITVKHSPFMRPANRRVLTQGQATRPSGEQASRSPHNALPPPFP